MSPEQSQQEFLIAVKADLGLDWDTLAFRAGIAPRALKNYRLPSTSSGYRRMPDLAWRALEALQNAHPRANGPSQKDILHAAKAKLGTTWAEFAELSGIKPQALKNYLLPVTAKGHRKMPPLAVAAIERLLAARSSKRPKKSD